MTLCLIISATAAPLIGTAKKTKVGNDTPDQGLTLTATGLETQLESDGSYTLHGLAVVNGDESNMSGTINTGSAYEELEDQITNLTFDLNNMVMSGGPSTNFEIEVVLGLGVDNLDGSYTLSSESSVVIRGIDAEFIEGYVYNIDQYAPSATAVVKVNWDEKYYEFTLTMSAAPAEATVVVVEDATVEIEKYLLFGDTYDYALKMTGEWINPEDGLTYPVSVEVPVYYPEATEPSEIMSTVTVGDWGDNEGTLTVTTVNDVVTATGIVENPSTGIAIDITISGSLHTTGIENTTVTIKPVKKIQNGQLIIEKDGVQYNAQGATLK